MFGKSLRVSSLGLVGASLLASVAVQLPIAQSVMAAQPTPAHTRLVPDTPRTNVPRITTGEITDIAYIGNRVFIAGTFTSIRNNTTTNTTTVAQPSLAAYNIDTGLIDTAFRPVFGGGGVEEVEASPDGTKLFIVGRFNSVNGVTKRKVASINPTTGATITGFTANTGGPGPATSVEATNTTVYIGGQFTTVNGTARVGLAAVNSTTGAVVTAFNNNMSGGIGTNGTLTVQALVLTHDDTKLLVVHTGRQIAGQDRYGVGLISTVTNQLLPWRTRLWDENLQFVGGIQRAYAGDIAPNDQYFVVTSGSGGDRPPISDTAVAFPLNGNDNIQPLWVSRLFDSVYSVAITETAVYLGGHFNYMESPTAPDPWPGLDNVGYGQGQGLAGYGLGDDIVIRDHIGAVDPATGKALEWSPGSNSFEGNKAMLATPRGLFAGGDAGIQGGASVGRVAFYDFNSVPAAGPNETSIINPIEGRVKPADVPFVIDGLATAASGVNRVQIEVRNRNSGQYLQDDLTTWGAANTINANLASPGATSTAWSLPLTISGNNQFQLLARTFATNGTSDATKAIKKFETFGLADQTPDTFITGPIGTVVPTLTFTLTGTAQDDFGVNAITISARDAQNRYLQDDGTTGDTFNSFRSEPDVVGATAATWEYELILPYESAWVIQATAVDTAGQSDLRSAAVKKLVSATALAPTVAVTTPQLMNPPTANLPFTVAPGAPLTFTGSATDDQSLNFVSISLRNLTTRENLASDGNWGTDVIAGFYRISPLGIDAPSYNWSYTTPFNLKPGTYAFTVRATDNVGLTTSTANRGILTINAQVPGDAFPDGLLNVTGIITGLQTLHLDLAGTATDDKGVASVKVTIQDRVTRRYLQANNTFSTAFSLLPATLASPGQLGTTWTLPIDLPAQGDFDVIAYAYDTVGQQDPSTTGATARYQIYPGDTPPVFVDLLLSPTEGTVFNDAKIFVSGRLEDDQQMAAAQVGIVNSLGQYLSATGTFTSTLPSFRTAYLNSVGTPGSNFSYTTPAIPAGAYTVIMRGVDQHGLITTVPPERHVTVAVPASNLAPVAAFTVSCLANVCSFDGRTSTDENAPVLTYAWSFGQASALGTGPIPKRTYTGAGTFTVGLTVKDEFGVTGTTSQLLTIVEPPANVAPTPLINTPSCSALVCNFSAVGTVDVNLGDTITYLWNFGDASPTATSTLIATPHTFPAAGTYNVSLTATDGWLKGASIILPVTVSGVAVDPPPVANFTSSCTLLACTFTSTSTDNGSIAGVAWTFGDATSGTTNPVLHTYAGSANYTVTLTVTDNLGATGVITKIVPVSSVPPNPPPVANFTSSCTLLACTFTSTSTDEAGPITNFSWNFGDGTALGTTSPITHNYANGGNFSVSLTVVDVGGASATSTKVVPVTGPNTPPVANFTSNCTFLSCTFTSTSTDNVAVTGVSWNFGDATPAGTLTPVTHVFGAAGTYQVQLTATDGSALTGSITQAITVSAQPVGGTATFRAANSSSGAGAAASVAIPATVQAGDQLLFFVTVNADTTATTPAGWTLLGTQQDGTPDVRSWVFTRTATAGGGTVSTTFGAGTPKSTRIVVAYSGAAVPTVIANSVIAAASATTLAAPSVNVAANNSRVVRFWAVKTSTDGTAWSLPGAVTSLAATAGTGGGLVSSAAGDSAATAGASGAATATSSVASGKGIAFSVVVGPA